MNQILAVTINLQDKNISPSTEAKTVTADSNYSGLDKVTIEPVTSAIDSNIIPENIKKDVSILGVVGTLESIPMPAKSWFYVTEWDSNGYPIKAKTIGCSGNMPSYMYGNNREYYPNILTKSLQEFEINEGVTSIGYYAFCSCENLKKINIPNSVTSIVSYAFWRCFNLTSLVIPNGVTSIGTWAFRNCGSLTSINLPDGLTDIGEYAFYDCSSLTSITIPDSVTSIGRYTFVRCSSLTSITIGNSVTSIGQEAFYNCTKLTSIVMPMALTSIGSSAFYYCSKLALFDFRRVTQVPTLANISAFQATPEKKKIVVPDELYDTWITATNWSSSSYNIVSSIIKASDYEASL